MSGHDSVHAFLTSCITLPQCVRRKSLLSSFFQGHEPGCWGVTRRRAKRFELLAKAWLTSCSISLSLCRKLLQFYSSMATGKGAGGASDNEMPTFCAYNFPAVMLTVGKENWAFLEEAYNEMIKDIQWKVCLCAFHHKISVGAIRISVERFICELRLYFKRRTDGMRRGLP